MRWFRADLHIHSVLSPCGSLEMSPRRIVEEARKAGLDLIAVCDHNACANGQYVRKIAKGYPTVLMGMEIQTVEEVEVLALFAEEQPCLSLGQELYALLPPLRNQPELFGDQLVVDEHDEIVQALEKLLLSPVPLSLEEVVVRVQALGGLVIPAHVDRVPGGILGVLGLLGAWPAVEISPWTDIEGAKKNWPELETTKIFRFSDAHYPWEIGRAWTEIYLTEPSFAELMSAIRGEGGRLVCPGPAYKED